MKLSTFGKKFTTESGILTLMDDLGNALAGDKEMIMMGGGNPAHIPEVEQRLKARLQQVVDDPKTFRQLVGIYDPPQGHLGLLNDLAALLKKQLGWNITARNIALTNGSQSGFFMLFNMFAGKFDDGSRRKIQLPLAPEYIGYADAGLEREFFTAGHPQIERQDNHLFKYRIDFNEVSIGEETGAICVSRPTNPTGNVITDDELARLDALAQRHDIPLMIDGAYGMPFPNLIYTPATPMWNENSIVCLSLSKLGLPAARTGIIVASEEVIQAVSGINAIINLASGSFGAVMTQELVKTGEIITLSNEVVRPHYQRRSEEAVAAFQKAFGDQLPFHIHKPEGAMFLWLWFEGLPISSQTLYERLKERGVVVVSGHHFFPGINDDNWAHQQECIRVNYAAQEPAVVQRGIDIIAEEVRKAYAEG